MNVEKTSVTLEASAFFDVFWHWFEPSFLEINHMTWGIKCQLVWREKMPFDMIATKDRVFLPQKVTKWTPNCQLKSVPDSSINSTEGWPKNSENFMGRMFICLKISACCMFILDFSRNCTVQYGSMIFEHVDLPAFGYLMHCITVWTLLISLVWTLWTCFDQGQ